MPAEADPSTDSARVVLKFQRFPEPRSDDSAAAIVDAVNEMTPFRSGERGRARKEKPRNLSAAGFDIVSERLCFRVRLTRRP